jgi:predicted amidohydrolase
MPRANRPDPVQLAADAFDRRTFMSRVAAAAGMAGLGLGALRPAAAATGKGADVPSMNTDGTYPVVPLTRDSVSLAVMQTRVRPVDAARPETGRRENLEHMLELIDNTQTYGPVKDILFFHEFPITGFRFEWNRADVLRVAIEVPGPETEVLAKKAKQYGCYIVFGSYVRDDKDWPNHSLSITTILGPDGTIVDRHWKARNIMGVFTAGREPIELMTSTIYNCFDRFVEMYGVDAVIPVTRTPIGNICTSSVQREPELFRAMTLKGAEIFLRTATGGFTPADIQACAMYNGLHGDLQQFDLARQQGHLGGCRRWQQRRLRSSRRDHGQGGVRRGAGSRCGNPNRFVPRAASVARDLLADVCAGLCALREQLSAVEVHAIPAVEPAGGGKVPARPEEPQLEIGFTRAVRDRPTAGSGRHSPA